MCVDDLGELLLGECKLQTYLKENPIKQGASPRGPRPKLVEVRKHLTAALDRGNLKVTFDGLLVVSLCSHFENFLIPYLFIFSFCMKFPVPIFKSCAVSFNSLGAVMLSLQCLAHCLHHKTMRSFSCVVLHILHSTGRLHPGS